MKNVNLCMIENDIRQQSFAKNLITLLVLLISCLFIGQIISAGLLFAYYGSDALNLEKILSSKNDNFNFIRIIQIVVSILCFGVPAILFSLIKRNNFFGYAFNQPNSNIFLWVLVPLLVISIYPFLNFTYVLNKQSIFGQLMKDQQEQYRLFIDALLGSKSFLIFIFNFIMIALVPAIVEEWIFRGTLQKYLAEKWNAHLAILISSIIFSLIHFEFSAFLPRIVLGMLLGYVFYFSKDIWLCIWMHLFNNGMEVTLMYIKNLRYTNQSLFEEPSMPTHLELIGYSTAFIVLMFIFYKLSDINKKTIFTN